MGSTKPRKSNAPSRRRAIESPRRKAIPAKPSNVRTTAKRPPISPTQVLREIRDGVQATELEEIHRKLEIAGAVAYICAALLTEEASDEQDVGLVLRRCVGDEIDRQMEEIDRLLGRERTFASDEGDGGDE